MNHWKSPPKKGKRGDMPELAATPKRDKKGCFVDRQRQVKEDPLKTVREARARQTGRDEDEVLWQIFGQEWGKAIVAEAVSKDEADKLFKVFSDYDAAEEMYYFRRHGKSRFGSGPNWEYVRDVFAVDPNAKPDLRTDEEKLDAAVKNWMHWKGLVGCLLAHERNALHRASWREDELFKDKVATVHGRQFVKALRMLRDVVEARGW